jgi:hypothetical protein
MGGYGSGRIGGRATTEDGLSLSLQNLLLDRQFRPGCAWAGSLVWTSRTTGERVVSIGYEAYLGQESGYVQLKCTTTEWDGGCQESDCWITLATTPQPFGGRRWWFVCPRTGRRAAKLYLPKGAFTFASRLAYRLAYRSQRETTHDRALRRAFKLRGKLEGLGGIGDYIPKPKWMRWPTYERRLEEVAAAEEVVDAHLRAFVEKLECRIGAL